ncbi:CDP-alcohol phosphatidyltransferase family protein [Pedobacter polysacchareus]|uniref:CDP-alcohol phosphatidyltransferase family protein n=1 Tax=Pedobacter polysacchareus TaxID=2861973 RepID=UPI001C993203|nr:CDP-alcohol phosphatidyltransferase family protein [Pedobacter polysacchareus]
MDHLKISTLAVNTITCYRILAAPILLLLIWKNEYDVFKWLFVVSFFTDALDGYLARSYKVVSKLGARLDSAGDDLTVIVAVIGIIKWNHAFLYDKRAIIIMLLVLLVIEVSLALIRYGKMTAYHTYISKTAAILQAIFLCTCFFIDKPSSMLFYITVIVTGIGLFEEILMTILLKTYRVDTKGLYWLFNKEKS